MLNKSSTSGTSTSRRRLASIDAASDQPLADFFGSEVRRLERAVGREFLRSATFEQVLEKTGISYAEGVLSRAAAMSTDAVTPEAQAINQLRHIWEIAVREVRQAHILMWNRNTSVGARVHYTKSAVEGKASLRTVSPAYLIGDLEVVDLEHIGTVLLEKVEVFDFGKYRLPHHGSRLEFLGIPVLGLGAKSGAMSVRNALGMALIWGVLGLSSALLAFSSGRMLFVLFGAVGLIAMSTFLWSAWRSHSRD